VRQRIMGLETEFGFLPVNREGRRVRSSGPVKDLIRAVGRQRAHLPGIGGGGMFLPAGRLYIDVGGHPEFCTAECMNPWDLVRYRLAGEQILFEGACEVNRQSPSVIVTVFKCGVDYSGALTTWGCHESYCYESREGADVSAAQLLPHLVTRVIYTGAGGLDPREPGVEFTLSPRAAHLQREISSSSTDGRGLFHTKDESLASDGYHRLHLLTGQSLCGELGTFLKAGVTAVITGLCEAGLAPGRQMKLASPLDALRTICRDPTCTATVRLADGRAVTAPWIQRQYLQRAEEHLSDGLLPPWAAEICHCWGETLDRLADAPYSVEASLDWAIKHALFQGRLADVGNVDPDALPCWNDVLRRLHAAAIRAELPPTVTPELVANPPACLQEELKRLTRLLEEQGQSWAGLQPLLDLRAQLAEIDVRFGQLGPEGIFAQLDRRGDLLDHHVDGVDNIAHAVANPPLTGRARVRGDVIQRLAGTQGAACYWNMVVDEGDADGRKPRVLDLSDPLSAQEHWEPVKANHELAGNPMLNLQASELIAGLRRSELLRRRVMGDDMAPGARVRVRGPARLITRRYLGQLATVTEVENDRLGPYAHLDIDQSRHRWRPRYLERIEPAPAEPSPADIF